MNTPRYFAVSTTFTCLLIFLASGLWAQNEPAVTRAAFTTAIEEREPVNQVDTVYSDVETVFYFTELRNLQGQKITHQWSRDGETLAEVTFDVQGPRWRVYSSKKLSLESVGDLMVNVLDGSGTKLHQDILTYLASGDPMQTTQVVQPVPEAEPAEGIPSSQPASEPMTGAEPELAQETQEEMAAPKEKVMKTAAMPKTTAESSTEAKNVPRALFTTEISEREPTNDIDTLRTDVSKVFFFTEVLDMTNKIVIHRWLYGDKVMAEVSFTIGGPRWRIHSSKNLEPSWTGPWKVEVLDGNGAKLCEETFVYAE